MSIDNTEDHLQDGNISGISAAFPTREEFTDSREEVFQRNTTLSTRRDQCKISAEYLTMENFIQDKKKLLQRKDTTAIASIKTDNSVENYEKENEESPNPELKDFFDQQPIVWTNVILFIFWHFVAIYGFFTTVHHVKWLTIIWAIFIYIFSDFGVVAGAHRLWSHRSYKVNLPMKILLLICFSTAGQNSVYRWAKDHRIHHKFTETNADPHNSKRGFFFAHMGWLMLRKHPEVVSKSPIIDMSDIKNDPVLAFHTKYFVYFKTIFCFVLPTLPPILLWNEYWLYSVIWLSFIRYMAAMHAVFSINSFAHMWGYRPYDKKINPAENLGVSLVVLGDGWHNYHHTFPWDYSSPPERPYLGRFDFTASVLDLFRKIGWVYDVKTASPELIRNTMKKHGDGSKIFEVPVEYADESKSRK